MGDPLRDRTVVLGVTGSIACYKALDLTSRLVQAGARVEVVLTASAQRLVSPLAFQALTHRPVLADLWAGLPGEPMPHVALGERADLVVVAPCTAHTLARLALGLADDALTALALSTRAPLLLAPAMDGGMYDHPATQEHVAALARRGVHIVGPAEGRLASGRVGQGRMAEVPELLGHIRWLLGRRGDLAGRRLVVTAGGTREPLDPVRVLTNRSTGKMGYALAEAARDRGAWVTLITASPLPPPPCVETVRVETALEMRDAVLRACPAADALLMAAAVADYRPAQVHPQKVRKGAGPWTVELVRNPDILAEVEGPLKVGFAAETEEVVERARRKLEAKGLDLIVANDVTAPGSGFGTDTNKVWLVDREGVEELPLLPKYEVAHRILDRVAALLRRRGP